MTHGEMVIKMSGLIGSLQAKLSIAAEMVERLEVKGAVTKGLKKEVIAYLDKAVQDSNVRFDEIIDGK